MSKLNRYCTRNGALLVVVLSGVGVALALGRWVALPGFALALVLSWDDAA